MRTDGKNTGWDHEKFSELVMAGSALGAPEILFRKIEDEEIEKQINRLHSTSTGMENEEKTLVPLKTETSFDDFSKMDIRAGTILEAEKVEGTDKLLKLLVDTGHDKRTVVSGIAQFYSPDEIIGRQVSILVNLQPRKLKGILSQGMILMAEDPQGKLTFVSPEKETLNGSIIK